MLLTLAELLDSFFHSAVLVGLAVALGGAIWERGVFGWPSPPVPQAARRRCLGLIATGAGLVAGAQIAGLGLQVFVLRASLGNVTLTDLGAATNFRAGALRALLSLALAASAVRARRDVPARLGPIALSLAALIALSGAWLTHAVGRLESRGLLMSFTILHQGAAATWLGGLIQLGALWRLGGTSPEVDALWPVAVRRLSRLAMVTVALLIGAALPLAWVYTRTLNGLIGTGYGSLLVLKMLLLLVTVALAALNLTTARQASSRDSANLRLRLPKLVEAETILLVLLVFAATGLSALPPPADQRPDEQATVAEVAKVFRPKIPSLETPSLEAMRRSEASKASGAPRTREAYLWSNYSHNTAGLILLVMSLTSLAGPTLGARFSRHWPLGLLALAAFIYLRASANEGTWPFGSTPIGEVDAEGLQHRIAAVLVLAMGLLEWRARCSRPGTPLTYLFPVLCVVGAALLLTHSHRTFQLKEGYLVQVTHSSMGALAGLVAVGRWLELRLPPGPGRLAGALASLAMLAIALILVFYREANVIIPPG
jgi:copper resistance protein D